jgi:predicted ATPase
MIQELYAHHFKCLQNFRLVLKEKSFSLLLGKNGVGKTTVASALEIFQKIGRGVNRIGQLVCPSDFTRHDTAVPMRFELEVLLGEKSYKYKIAFELPDGFSEARILEEELWLNQQSLYTRKNAEVILNRGNKEVNFLVDWHVVALPIIQSDFSQQFQSWLASILILSPIPPLMTGNVNGATLHPNRHVDNFGEWLTGLLTDYPASYTLIDRYIKQVIPDFYDLQNEQIGKNARNITIQFGHEKNDFSIDFNQLSDGEKCFFLCAVVLAMNKNMESLFCFWDEPDNYLSISEIQHFIIELQRNFKTKGQLLIASHHAQTIETFPPEHIIVLDRKSHLEPTLWKWLNEVSDKPKDLISALILNELEL